MITSTSINKPVILNVLRAMREAQKNGVAHVTNRKGNAFLAVRKRIVNGKVLFQVLDVNGKNMVRQILNNAIELMERDCITPNVAGLLVSRIGHEYKFAATQG